MWAISAYEAYVQETAQLVGMAKGARGRDIKRGASKTILVRRSDRLFPGGAGRFPTQLLTAEQHKAIRKRLSEAGRPVAARVALSDRMERLDQLYNEYVTSTIVVKQRMPAEFVKRLELSALRERDLLVPEYFKSAVYDPIYNSMITGQFERCISHMRSSIAGLQHSKALNGSRYWPSLMAATVGISTYCLHKMGHPMKKDALRHLKELQTLLVREDRDPVQMALLAYDSYDSKQSNNATAALDLAGKYGVKSHWEPGIRGCELRLALDYAISRKKAPSEPIRDLNGKSMLSIAKAHEDLGDSVIIGSFWKPHVALVTAHAHHGNLDEALVSAVSIRSAMRKLGVDMPHIQTNLMIEEARALWRKSESKECGLAATAVDKIEEASLISKKYGFPLVLDARSAHMQDVIDEIYSRQ